MPSQVINLKDTIEINGVEETSVKVRMPRFGDYRKLADKFEGVIDWRDYRVAGEFMAINTGLPISSIDSRSKRDADAIEKAIDDFLEGSGT